jgi:hypothetical protein
MRMGNRRRVISVVLAVLFIIAGIAFATQAWAAWESGDRTRLVIGVLATLGTILLALGRLRELRGPASRTPASPQEAR